MVSGEEHPTDLLSRPSRRVRRGGGFEVGDESDDESPSEEEEAGEEAEAEEEWEADDDWCDPGGDGGDGGDDTAIDDLATLPEMTTARGGATGTRRRTPRDVDAGDDESDSDYSAGSGGGEPPPPLRPCDQRQAVVSERAMTSVAIPSSSPSSLAPSGTRREGGRPQRRRSEAEGINHPAPPPPPLTELDAAFHMFSDAVNDYVSPPSRRGDDDTAAASPSPGRHPHLSGGEKDFLSTLRDLVSRDVDARNVTIHENRALVRRKRAAESEVSTLRHRVLAARERAREVRRECAALEREVAKARREEEDLDGANRFLWALTGLAQSASGSASATSPRRR